jgi:hypothetical protein
MAGDRSSTRRRYLWKGGHRRCYWCNCRLSWKSLTCDHYIPLSKGGTHKRTNLVAACAPCNQHRSSMSAAEYQYAFPGGAPRDVKRRLKPGPRGPGLLNQREQVRLRIEKARQRKLRREAEQAAGEA